MYRVCKEYKFEAAHILTSSYDSRDCENIHGHSYKVEVFLSSEKLTDEGMIINFSALNDIIHPILAELDHSLMVQENLMGLKDSLVINMDILGFKTVSFGFSPTAEKLAHYLFSRIETELINFSGINWNGYRPNLDKVRVWETAKAYAEWER